MLEDVHYKWYEMGVALKIPTSKLNEMVGTSDNAESCFRVSTHLCSFNLIQDARVCKLIIILPYR